VAGLVACVQDEDSSRGLALARAGGAVQGSIENGRGYFVWKKGNSTTRQGQQQIPFGDDNQRTGNSNCNCRSSSGMTNKKGKATAKA
jgi:hypothetical protein